MARQIFYTTTRLGIYRNVFDYMQKTKKSSFFFYNYNNIKIETSYINKYKIIKGDLKFVEKAECSLIAGFIGSLVGNPADLALVRMQADTTLPPNERRNYKHIFDAFSRITKEEGFKSLWRGSIPSVVRAMSLNLGMLAPYDEVKERMNKYYGSKDSKQARLMLIFFCNFF